MQPMMHVVDLWLLSLSRGLTVPDISLKSGDAR